MPCRASSPLDQSLGDCAEAVGDGGAGRGEYVDEDAADGLDVAGAICSMENSMTGSMPVLYVSHGAPPLADSGHWNPN
jgi:hypothetical protein